ncbi:MAG TPA: urate hydroxylase PuuD [Pyrinomonadaceae bacterium]|nr:urate hydroxylase PuuD [Pyrinomonadaceae bacterium]
MFEPTLHLPLSLAMLDGIFHAPSFEEITRIILRWSHFVAGITWIGILYFFNLINVNFMKSLDAPTKKVVVPSLMPPSLWFFRWGALITVVAGFGYFAMYILRGDVKNANAAGAGANVWVVLLVWLLIACVAWALYNFVLLPNLSKDGKILAVATAGLVIAMAVAIVWWLDSQLTGTAAGRPDHLASNKTFSIGIGGALGVIMLLNVWGIIWPAQKRIIAATAAGTPPDAALARRAFLASRTNAWLSLPMLFFMASSHGDWIILGRNAS